MGGGGGVGGWKATRLSTTRRVSTTTRLRKMGGGSVWEGEQMGVHNIRYSHLPTELELRFMCLELRCGRVPDVYTGSARK